MNAPVPVPERRKAFVRDLYTLHNQLCGERYVSAKARRDLARLRRAFAGPQQRAEAYDIVFAHDPPERESEREEQRISEPDLWVLVAGLFALHPQGNDAPGRSLGQAMGLLVDKRPSAARRFTQLLSVEGEALEHYLRQAIRLLRADGIPLDYHTLLVDLAEMQKGREQIHRVRLGWARDYHRAKRQGAGRPSAAGSSGAVAQPDTAAEPSTATLSTQETQ